MPPKNSTAKRTRPRAPGVKAGLELMANLGGIAVLGTQQTPYYYFPPEKRIRAGVDRCTRCVTACGPKAACNVQPLLRVGTNLWKSRQCYYCTIFPAQLQGETCSLDGALYVFDGDRGRLLAVNAKGEVLDRPIDELDLSDLATPADSPISSAPATPTEKNTTLTPAVVKMPVVAEVNTKPKAQAETESTPTTTLSTTIPAPIKIVKTTVPSAPASPIVRLSPEWTNRPVVPPTPPAPTSLSVGTLSTPAVEAVSVPTTPPARSAPILEPATPADAEIVTPVSGTPAHVVETSPSPEYQWLKNDLSLVNRKTKTSTLPPTQLKPPSLPLPAKAEVQTDSEVKRVIITDAAKSAPLFPPVVATSLFKAAPVVASAPVQDEDVLAQLAVSRRPLAALNALSALLEGELVQLNAANAEVERLRALVRAKETECDSRTARVNRYRTAIDTALSALEEERTALTRMRATLAAALKC